jgi:hypothetical protein
VQSAPFGGLRESRFLFVPANVSHTMAADEDTIIIGTAFGPWHTHHSEDHHHH